MGIKTEFRDPDLESSDKAEGWLPNLLNLLFKHKYIVNCDRDVYLRRWYIIRTSKFALFVHQFIRSDEDRALHCHPWNFIVIPIWRGYIEHCQRVNYWYGRTPHARRVWPIIGTRFRPATYRHRVELLPCSESPFFFQHIDCPTCNGRTIKPSWSIFIRFLEHREWGFWNPKFISWKKWWSDKCED